MANMICYQNKNNTCKIILSLLLQKLSINISKIYLQSFLFTMITLIKNSHNESTSRLQKYSINKKIKVLYLFLSAEIVYTWFAVKQFDKVYVA